MNFFDQNSAPAISGNFANSAFRLASKVLTTIRYEVYVRLCIYIICSYIIILNILGSD